MSGKETLLKVYYDGACPLCFKEIEHYKKKKLSHLIDFIDITTPNFDAESEGLDKTKIHAVFHVKDKNGTLHTGVSGFLKIWQTLKIFKILTSMAKNPLMRPFMDLSYKVFAKIRPLLPKRKCETDRCQT